MKPELLRCEEVAKSFAGVPVLKRVSLSVTEGAILGVVGENGAGKSTLMNLIGGVHAPDSGRMWIGGEEYRPRDPSSALTAGIAFVHQELNLFPNLSIADNLFLANPPARRVAGVALLNRKRMRESAMQALQQTGLDRAPDTLVESLSPGDRQLVEIAKAVHARARLIIFDEPTTSLTAPEVDRLFKLLSELRASGVTMLYISHALEHVLRMCDNVLVLRDGAVVDGGPVGEFTDSRLIRAMVGREVNQLFPSRRVGADARADSAALEARDLSEPGVIEGVSFSVQPGEIVGVAGLMGSGRTELARILFGLDPVSAGEILLAGEPVQHLRTRERIERGLALVTESRREDGLFLNASVRENVQIVHGDRARASDLAAQLWIVCANVETQPVSQLSGGNQQKTAIAKWLAVPPKVLILDEPTRGIDIGAKQEIYELLARLAASGMALLVISSEAEELLGLCDRILVMAHGEIRQELRAKSATREDILRAAV